MTLKFKELVDIEKFRILLEKFAMLNNISIGLLEYPSLELLLTINWKDTCVKFHRSNPVSAQECFKSNRILIDSLKEKNQINICRCNNGLVDGATPIIIDGEHLATLSTGQVFIGEPDLLRFEAQANQFGFNTEDYLNSLKNIPVLTEEQFRSNLLYLSDLATIIADTGLKNKLLEMSKKELAKSEAQLESIFDRTKMGVVLSDCDGRPIRFNKAFLDITGQDENTIYDSTLRKVEHSSHNEEDHILFQQIKEKKVTHKILERKIYKPSGESIWISCNLTVINDKMGNPVNVFCLVEDITESKLDKERLIQTQYQQQAILDNIPDIAWLKDKDHKYIAINKAGAELRNQNPEDIVGKTDFDIWPESIAQFCRKDDIEVLESKKRLVIEEEIMDSDNNPIIVETIKTPILNDKGEAIGTTGISRNITQRIELENQLNASNHRFRNIFNYTRNGLMTFEVVDNGREFIFADINKAAETIGKKKKQDIIGKSLAECYPGVVNLGIYDLLNKVWNTAEYIYIPEINYKDENINIYLSANIIKVSATEIAIIVNDITDLKIKELALSLTQFSVDHSTIITFWVDQDANIINANQMACELLGYTKEEIVSLKPFDLTPYLISEKWNEAWEYLKRQKTTTSETFCIRKDGSTFPIEFMCHYFEFDGKEYNFVCINDISLRLETVSELKRTQFSVENSSIATICIDPTGKVININKQACHLYGYTQKEFLSRTLFDFVSNYTPETFKLKWQYYKEKSSVKFENIHKRKDGTDFIAEITLNFFEFEEKEYLFAYIFDITERKKLEKELEQKTYHLEQLVEEQTKKLKEYIIQLESANSHKNQFLSNMSHELRTPLNAIIGFTNLLEEQHYGIVNEKQLEYLNYVTTSAKHLLSLINDLLDLTRIDAGKMEIYQEILSLSKLIDQITNIMKPQFDHKNIALNVNLNSETDEIYTDFRKFNQIMMNLLTNALKYTSEGGNVTISSEKNKNEMVKIIISDTGIGISQADIDKIFEEFYQVKQVKASSELGGAGIGLALTLRLVELLGGQIGVTSEEDKGSTFWFTIPINQQSLEKNKDINKIEKNVQRSRILVADDNDLNIKLLSDILKSLDQNVILAKNGQEALNMAITYKPDIILMDLKMPIMDGVTVTKKLRELSQFKDTPILALSALTEDEARRKLDMNDFTGHIEKPFKIKKLIETVESYLCELKKSK